MATPKLEVLEERVANMLEQNKEEHNTILGEIAKINDKLDKTFVTKTEFNPIKRIVYFIVLAVATAVVSYAIKVIASHGAI